LLQALQQVRDHGICFLRGAPAAAGRVEDLSLRFGFPQESNFGPVQDLVFDPAKRSIANDQTGAGSSTFVDGFEIAERLRAHDLEGSYALCNNSQPFRRHFADDVDLIADFPLISLDDFGNLCGVRINDHVAAPAAIAPQQVEAC
jgi:hypothetical protein